MRRLKRQNLGCFECEWFRIGGADPTHGELSAPKPPEDIWRQKMGLDFEQARQIAQSWISAWNARDLEAVLSHYSDDIEICSPLVVSRLGRQDGILRGKDALRAYFARGMENAALRFELSGLRLGVEAMVVLYRRENGVEAADTMVMNENGQVVRMWACYGQGESLV